jgi:hypothetical protein
VIALDTLRYILARMDSGKTVIGIPTEVERVAVSPADIEAWFDMLEAAVRNVPRQFIFKVDETG